MTTTAPVPTNTAKPRTIRSAPTRPARPAKRRRDKTAGDSTPRAPSAPTSEAIAARLRQLQNELVVRNHLASMEVRNAVQELSKEVEKIADAFAHKIEQSVSSFPNEARLRLHLAILEGNARLLEMESALKTALAGAARSASIVAETARLKGTLARMDAQDAAERRRKALKDELRRLEAKSERVLRDIEKRLVALDIEAKKIVSG